MAWSYAVYIYALGYVLYVFCLCCCNTCSFADPALRDSLSHCLVLETGPGVPVDLIRHKFEVQHHLSSERVVILQKGF